MEAINSVILQVADILLQFFPFTITVNSDWGCPNIAPDIYSVSPRIVSHTVLTMRGCVNDIALSWDQEKSAHQVSPEAGKEERLVCFRHKPPAPEGSCTLCPPDLSPFQNIMFLIQLPEDSIMCVICQLTEWHINV